MTLVLCSIGIQSVFALLLRTNLPLLSKKKTCPFAAGERLPTNAGLRHRAAHLLFHPVSIPQRSPSKNHPHLRRRSLPPSPQQETQPGTRRAAVLIPGELPAALYIPVPQCARRSLPRARVVFPDDSPGRPRLLREQGFAARRRHRVPLRRCPALLRWTGCIDR